LTTIQQINAIQDSNSNADMKLSTTAFILACISVPFAAGQEPSALRAQAEQEAEGERRQVVESRLETELAGWADLPESVRELFIKMHLAVVAAPEPRQLTPEQQRQAAAAAANAAAVRAELERIKAERRSYFRHRDLVSKAGAGESLAERQAGKRLRMRLEAAAKKADQQQKQRDAEAILRAAGIPIRGNGTYPHTTSFGVPQIYGSRNENAAETTSTDLIQPGGTLGFDLDGTGTTLGIWEIGDVRVTHTEFTTGGVRAVDRDGVSPNGLDDHAAHVAGTMVASGEGAGAQGMSPKANLDTFDSVGDYGEMRTASSDPDPALNLQISNHSYGPLRGWIVSTITIPFLNNGNPFNSWIWLGETTVSATEDSLFGFYDDDSQEIDELIYDAETYLPVWAIPDERGIGNIGPALANQPVFHLAPVNGGFQIFDSGIPGQNPSVNRPQDNQFNGFDTLDQLSVAKNLLAVGSAADIVGGYSQPSDVQVSPFSAFGPPDDGHIAPHVLGNGDVLTSAYSNSDTAYGTFSGTSMAAPNVAGSINLWTELYEQLHPQALPMLASTRKALAIHTADEAGANLGPDYQHGYGLFNAATGATLLDDNNTNATRPFIKEVVLLNGDFIDFRVFSEGTEALKVTACWTDPEGTPPALALDPNDVMLVNDLDLRVIQDTTTHFPWRLDRNNPANAATRTGDVTVDNVEQVVIDSPGASVEHVVRITHKGSLVDDTGAADAQAVSIIVSGNLIEPQLPLAISAVERDAGTGDVDLTWPSIVGDRYQVESSPDLTLVIGLSEAARSAPRKRK
jgi:hypothetical protein